MAKKKKNPAQFFFNNKNPMSNHAVNDLENQINKFLRAVKTETPLFVLGLEKVEKQFNYRVRHEGADCFLHSLFNRKREMERMFRAVDPDVEVLVIFGFGCGYALDYAGEHFPNLERVFIVEPGIRLLQTVLRNKEAVEQLKKVKTVTFIYNKSREEAAAQIASEMSDNVKKKYGIVFHLSYRSLFKGYYESIHEQLLHYVRQTQVNIATVDHNIYLKTQNIINNLTAKSVDIDDLLSKLRGIPAILVSAGPSLNKNIHLLEAAKEKAFVVAVGSAVKILYNKGIKPHARAAFSPYPDENTVFHGITDFEGIPLLYSNTLDYLVVERYHAPKARMVMLGDPISRYLYTRCGLKHALVGGGGTIANVTFDLLCRAGCSKVIFTGQDMCMTDNSLYADGSWADPKISDNVAGLIKARDVYGNDVYTSKAFLGIKKDFENAIQMYGGIEFINATEGGLPMEGTVNRTLQEVLDGIPETRDIQGLIEDVFQEAEKTEAGAAAAINSAIVQIQKEMEEILNINESRANDLRTVLSSGESITRVWSRLKEMQQHEEKLMALPLYAQVIQPELASLYYSISAANQYDGRSVEKKAESLSNTLVGYTAKLFEYGRFFKELLDNQVAKNDPEQQDIVPAAGFGR